VKTKTKKRKPHNPGPSPDNTTSSSSNLPPLRSVVTSLQQTVEKLAEEMRTGFKTINTRLDKQDEFNKVVTDYMKSHP
ncbi:MAG: hypothetical protein LBF36_02305, partial [Mycoplasmataceae bacterium]|nr:hypothetical protein [Mycoplasmataceae bacterium]